MRSGLRSRAHWPASPSPGAVGRPRSARRYTVAADAPQAAVVAVDQVQQTATHVEQAGQPREQAARQFVGIAGLLQGQRQLGGLPLVLALLRNPLLQPTEIGQRSRQIADFGRVGLMADDAVVGARELALHLLVQVQQGLDDAPTVKQHQQGDDEHDVGQDQPASQPA